MTLCVTPCPIAGEAVMATVKSYINESMGYTVNLDEYGLEAILMPNALSSKKIKKNIATFLSIGEKLPLVVLETSGDERPLILVSKKDIKEAAANLCKEYYNTTARLATLSNRLSHMSSFSREEWEAQFRSLLANYLDNNEKGENIADHPYNQLYNRAVLQELEIPSEYKEILLDKHVTLFGVNIQTVTKPVTIQSYRSDGSRYVKDALVSVVSKYGQYTDQQLYDNQGLTSVTITPVAIPTFNVICSAYNRSKAEETMSEVIEQLRLFNFDYFDV